LQDDPFFLTIHDDEDEEKITYRDVFSPRNETTTPRKSEHSTSPTTSSSEKSVSPTRSPSLQRAPSPHGHLQRSKSVVQWKASFLSPPRPKKHPERGASPSLYKRTPTKTPTMTPKKTPGHSPSPDTREWPDWARAQLKKQSSCQTSMDASSNTMGSLAFSEDSDGPSPCKDEPHNQTRRRGSSTIGSTTARSKLIGLNFLESSSNQTFEI
jgi:hypothetical protein